MYISTVLQNTLIYYYTPKYNTSRIIHTSMWPLIYKISQALLYILTGYQAIKSKINRILVENAFRPNPYKLLKQNFMITCIASLALKPPVRQWIYLVFLREATKQTSTLSIHSVYPKCTKVFNVLLCYKALNFHNRQKHKKNSIKSILPQRKIRYCS